DLAGPSGRACVVRDPREGLADLVVRDDEAHRERSLRWQRTQRALDAPGATARNAEGADTIVLLEGRPRRGASEMRAIVVRRQWRRDDVEQDGRQEKCAAHAPTLGRSVPRVCPSRVTRSRDAADQNEGPRLRDRQAQVGTGAATLSWAVTGLCFSSMTSTNRSTMSGSSWVPAAARSSRIASPVVTAPR